MLTELTNPNGRQRVQVRLPSEAGPVLKHVAALMIRQVEQRCRTRADAVCTTPCQVELAVEPGIGVEGFRITDHPTGVIRISGNDERGVLYGVGKFLRSSGYENGEFRPGTWRGTSVPEKPIRGIYLATHFYNYYQEAPIAEVEHYVEELGLWGFNTVLVWYDMHHFNGFADPAAVRFREHLRKILQAVRNIGLGIGFLLIGNQAYGNSPAELRMDPFEYRPDHYPNLVCPSKPGGMEYILKGFGELLDWAEDLQPACLVLYPYDAGGCGCPGCRPWGGNGFLRCCEAVATLAKKKFAEVQIIVATSYFDFNIMTNKFYFADQVEWRGLQKVLAGKPAWINAIMAEPPRSIYDDVTWFGYHFGQLETILSPPPAGSVKRTGDLPVVEFPDISMWGMRPWGGYGATPLPRHNQQLWRAGAALCQGGFPYSEGIFEDVNKVMYSQFYWQADRDATDILDEYIAYEFSPKVVAELRAAILLMEQNHGVPDLERAIKVDDLFRQAEPLLTAGVQATWRWRILRLRASNDLLVATLNRNFNELTELYHVQKVRAQGLVGTGQDSIAPPRLGYYGT